MTTCGNFSKFFRKTLRFETLKNFNIFGHFLHLCRKIAPLFPSRKTERKIVQKIFQNFVRLPNIFCPVFAILPPFGVGRTLLCFARVPEPRVLSPAASDSAAFRRQAAQHARAILLSIFTAARMTPSACADRPAEPPHRRGSGRSAVTSALSLPYNMSFPPFACRGLRGVCGAIGAPF